MRHRCILTVFFLFSGWWITVAPTCSASDTLRAVVWLADKESSLYNPLSVFKANAVERRIMHGFSLNNLGDYPVNQKYLDIITQTGAEILFASRWMNAVFVKAPPESIQKVRILSFVLKVEYQNNNDVLMTENNESEIRDLMVGAKRQTDRMGLMDFRNKNLNGKGITIAILDAGFPDVDNHVAFEHLRQQGLIKGGYDFRRNRNNAYRGHYHGTAVLSNIAGIYENQPMGLATGASFLLALTESNLFEPYGEERRWLEAAEWADREGAHIINSSLGYGARLYFESDMNGKNSLVAKAANEAAKRGILVVNSAGNEGQTNWYSIITPADADSVLTVGGVNPNTDYHVGFGSFGPTADKRRKPNVSAFAVCTAAKPGNRYTTLNGTSFSAPLVSGFAACAWQNTPGMTNMELFKAIEQSGHLFPYFDYAHGHGIPQAINFLEAHSTPVPTLKIIREADGYAIHLTENARTLQSNNQFLGMQYLYCHVENSEGYLNAYWVVDLREGENFRLSYEDLGLGAVAIKAHFNGYTTEISLP